MKLELISLKICPFAQRAVITLLHKKMPYTVTYIDLAEPPDWFNSVSPFGRVPVLVVDDKTVIFDSAIIDEFLEEICPGQLLPTDPLLRAVDRSIIDVGTNMLQDFSGMIHATDQVSFDEKSKKLNKSLRWLNTQIKKAPYFCGDQLSLVDIAFAPFFMRVQLLNVEKTFGSAGEIQHVMAWGSELLKLPELERSVVDDFNDILKNHIRQKAPYAANRLGLQ